MTSGNYFNTFDTEAASTYSANFITANGGTVAGAETVLFNGLVAGQAYMNVHSSQFMAGEIRGFLTSEPGTFGLLTVGLGVLAGLARWRRS